MLKDTVFPTKYLAKTNSLNYMVIVPLQQVKPERIPYDEAADIVSDMTNLIYKTEDYYANKWIK